MNDQNPTDPPQSGNNPNQQVPPWVTPVEPTGDASSPAWPSDPNQTPPQTPGVPPMEAQPTWPAANSSSSGLAAETGLPNSPTPPNTPDLGGAPSFPSVDGNGAPTVSSLPTNSFAPQPQAANPWDTPTPTTSDPANSNPPSPGLAFGQINTSEIPTAPSGNTTPPGPNITSEPAPTDLSQLTGNSDQPPPPEVYNPPVSNPENLVVPQTPSAETIHSGSSGNSKMPLFLIIGGIIVVLVVAAASAYFILGVGKAPEPTPAPSLPAQAPLTNPPKQVPVATPLSASSSAQATGSASLGGLGNSNSASGSSGLSAVERLKARQQSVSPSAKP